MKYLRVEDLSSINGYLLELCRRDANKIAKANTIIAKQQGKIDSLTQRRVKNLESMKTVQATIKELRAETRRIAEL